MSGPGRVERTGSPRGTTALARPGAATPWQWLNLRGFLERRPIAAARALAITPQILTPFGTERKGIVTKIGEVIDDAQLKIAVKQALLTTRSQARFLVEIRSGTAPLARPAVILIDELVNQRAGERVASDQELLYLGAIERELSSLFIRAVEEQSENEGQLAQRAKQLIVVSILITRVQMKLAAGRAGEKIEPLEDEDVAGLAREQAQDRPEPGPARAPAAAAPAAAPAPSAAPRPAEGLPAPLGPGAFRDEVTHVAPRWGAAAPSAARRTSGAAPAEGPVAEPPMRDVEEEVLDRTIAQPMGTLETLAGELDAATKQKRDLRTRIEDSERQVQTNMARAAELRDLLGIKDGDIADARTDKERAEERLNEAEAALKGPRDQIEQQARNVALAVEKAQRDLDALFQRTTGEFQGEVRRILTALGEATDTATSGVDAALSPMGLSLAALGPRILAEARATGVKVNIAPDAASADGPGAHSVEPLLSAARGFADTGPLVSAFAPLMPESPAFVGLTVAQGLEQAAARMKAGAIHTGAKAAAGAQAAFERRLTGKREAVAEARGRLERYEQERSEVERQHREAVENHEAASRIIDESRQTLTRLDEDATTQSAFDAMLASVRARIAEVKGRTGNVEFIRERNRRVDELEARARGKGKGKGPVEQGAAGAPTGEGADPFAKPVDPDEITFDLVEDEAPAGSPAAAAIEREAGGQPDQLFGSADLARGSGAEEAPVDPFAARADRRRTPPPPPADELDLDGAVLREPAPARTEEVRVPAAPAPAGAPAAPASAPEPEPVRRVTPPPPALKPLTPDMEGSVAAVLDWLAKGALGKSGDVDVDLAYDLAYFGVELLLEADMEFELLHAASGVSAERIGALRLMIEAKKLESEA